MALSDELAKLQELHQRGALTDDESDLSSL